MKCWTKSFFPDGDHRETGFAALVGVGFYLGWGHTLTFHGLNKNTTQINVWPKWKENHNLTKVIKAIITAAISWFWNTHLYFLRAGDFVGVADGRGLPPLEAPASSWECSCLPCLYLTHNQHPHHIAGHCGPTAGPHLSFENIYFHLKVLYTSPHLDTIPSQPNPFIAPRC